MSALNEHGTIRHEGYTVLCPACNRISAHSFSETKKAAAKEFVEWGWKRVRGLWVCPHCQEDPGWHNKPEFNQYSATGG